MKNWFATHVNKARQAAQAIVLLLAFPLMLNGCAPPYDRYMREGKELQTKGDLKKAREKYHLAVMESRHDTKSRKRLIEALLAEVECATATHDNDDAISLLDEAAVAMEKEFDMKRAAMTHKQAGDLIASSGDLRSSLPEFTKGLEDLKSVGEDITPEAAKLHAAIGDVKRGQHDSKQAAHEYEKACALLDKIKYHENDRDHAKFLYTLAAIYEDLNRDNDSIECQEKAKSFEMTGINDLIGRQPKM